MIYLMFQKEIIGNIIIEDRENVWVYGSYVLYENAKKFKEFFQALVNEDSFSFDESNFDKEFLKEDNWFLNINGNIVGITIPAIYFEDNFISFRFR